MHSACLIPSLLTDIGPEFYGLPMPFHEELPQTGISRASLFNETITLLAYQVCSPVINSVLIKVHIKTLSSTPNAIYGPKFQQQAHASIHFLPQLVIPLPCLILHSVHVIGVGVLGLALSQLRCITKITTLCA
jgi:hypothetical protein